VQKSKLVQVMVLIVALALLVAACGPVAQPGTSGSEAIVSDAQPEAQAAGAEDTATDDRGVFRIAHPKEFSGKASLDPCSPTRFTPLVSILYDRLVKPDDNGIPSPELAESWEVDETATVWTFHLREGVTFHDGSPLTSKDVVSTLKHCLDPDTEAPIASTLGIIDLEGFETPDDQTVVIKLTQPHADFTVLLMDYRARILKEGSIPTIEETGLGTGPFKLESLDRDGTTLLAANDDYWAGKPGVSAIEVIGIADADARTQALLAGQIHEGSVPPEKLPLFEENPNFEVRQAPSGGWKVLVMNTTLEPFDDVRVRQAMKLVVDRQAMLDLVLQGRGTIAYDHPVWPGDQYYTELAYERDVAQAKDLLAEAGYPDGLDVELYFSEVDATFSKMAVVYKEMAAEAGINVELKQVPTDDYWNEIWLIKPFMASYWGERPADQVLNEVFRSGASWNETAWDNPDYDALLDQARQEVDAEKRTALYHQAEALLAEDGGSIIPFFINTISVISKDVAYMKIFPETEYYTIQLKQ